MTSGGALRAVPALSDSIALAEPSTARVSTSWSLATFEGTADTVTYFGVISADAAADVRQGLVGAGDGQAEVAGNGPLC